MTDDQAFPAAWGNHEQGGDYVPGMSLRDYFAGQALAGIGTWTPEHGGGVLSTSAAMQARALWAYEQADAMLAERNRSGD